MRRRSPPGARIKVKRHHQRTEVLVADAAGAYSSGMASYLEWVRQFCLSLPHTTEKVRWEHNLLFCIGEKMYCVANLEPGMGPSKIAFKCTPEIFAELVEVEGMIPAPYMAHNHWVSVTEMEPFRQTELKEHIENSYRLVLAKLPKKTQTRLSGTNPAPKRSSTKQKPAVKRKK
jgi:predicted DNA-binding protein (MmcQ/YjbR family)